MEKEKMLKIWAIIIKAVIIISVGLGVFFSQMSAGFMGQSQFLFYTLQSNLVIGAIALVFLILDIMELVKQKPLIPNWLRVVKFSLTVAISLTFVVFSLILTPNLIATGMAYYLLSGSNLFLHNIVPILAILDFFLFDYKIVARKWTFLYGAIMPLYYVIFAMICSVSGVDFGKGANVPYFFFDYNTLGWFTIGANGMGVAYWIILQVAMVLLMSYFYIKICKHIQKKKQKALVM